MAIALLYVLIFNSSFAAVCLVIYAIGVCVTLIYTTDDIKNDLQILNESAKSKKNRPEVVKQFIRFVDIHSDAMQ